jgi:hypothetical protein
MLRDASGTITSGNVAQTALAANPNRRHLFIQNLDAAETMWVNFGSVATLGTTPGSIEVSAQTATAATNFLRYDAPAAVPDESISIIAATTGHKFTIKWA